MAKRKSNAQEQSLPQELSRAVLTREEADLMADLRKKDHQIIGGCFVVWAEGGWYWTGKLWSSWWGDALQFAGPPTPYERCLALSDELRKRFGISCNAAYIPRSEVSAGKLPGFRALRRVFRRDLDILPSATAEIHLDVKHYRSTPDGLDKNPNGV